MEQLVSREEITVLIRARHRQEGETSIDRVRISGRLHGIGDRVIVRAFGPDLIFSGTIVDIYYLAPYELKIIVERRCGCNLIFYRTELHHLHARENIIDNVRG